MINARAKTLLEKPFKCVVVFTAWAADWSIVRLEVRNGEESYRRESRHGPKQESEH